ncbi:MAG: EF-P lysine aminoacylase EpmA [Planctomycetia bacterium]|nr:EF-P lysine aminoacylase EpmA [Planctomycetia bacterium]
MDFRPSASLENLRRRAQIIGEIRSYFDRRDFLEVQTPILSRDTVIDQYIDPISLPIRFQGKQETFYMQTSPEYAMKRLLAAGMERIYQITPVFRSGDRGKTHNIEFTMLEWYRVGDSYTEGMDLLADLVCAIGSFSRCDRLSFGEAVERSTGLNPHRATAKDYQRYAEEKGIVCPESFTDPQSSASNGDWLDLVFSEVVQPDLGKENPIILYDYPGTDAQLAQSRKEKFSDGEEYQVAERFELFIHGLELANGYHELLDPEELRRRNVRTLEQRKKAGKDPLPAESRLLQAMDHGLPPCCGCALGVERLLMILLNSDSIDQVLPFPIDIA